MKMKDYVSLLIIYITKMLRNVMSRMASFATQVQKGSSSSSSSSGSLTQYR